MSGSWHLYRDGESWQRPHHQLRALIEVDRLARGVLQRPGRRDVPPPDASRHPGLRRPRPRPLPRRRRPRPLRRAADVVRRSPTAAWPRCCSTSACSAASATSSAARCCGRASSARSPRSADLPGGRRRAPRQRGRHAAAGQPARHAEPDHRPGRPGRARRLRPQRTARASAAASTIEARRVGEHARIAVLVPGLPGPLRPPPTSATTRGSDGPRTRRRRKFLADLPWRRTG